MDEYEYEFEGYYYSDFGYDDTDGYKLHLVDHKIRTARRDYECSKCHNKIAANTKYMDFATRYMRTRFCIDCGESITDED